MNINVLVLKAIPYTVNKIINRLINKSETYIFHLYHTNRSNSGITNTQNVKLHMCDINEIYGKIQKFVLQNNIYIVIGNNISTKVVSEVLQCNRHVILLDNSQIVLKNTYTDLNVLDSLIPNYFSDEKINQTEIQNEQQRKRLEQERQRKRLEQERQRERLEEERQRKRLEQERQRERLEEERQRKRLEQDKETNIIPSQNIDNKKIQHEKYIIDLLYNTKDNAIHWIDSFEWKVESFKQQIQQELQRIQATINSFASNNNDNINVIDKEYELCKSMNDTFELLPSYEPKKNKVIVIACHANSITRCATIVNNIQYFKNFDIVIVNSTKMEYLELLKAQLETMKNINLIQMINIENDNSFDFGKWFHIVKNNDLSNYEHVIFTNDSIFLFNNLDKYINYIDSNNQYDVIGYNDSSEIKRHYQSYLFCIHSRALDKFTAFFEKHRPLIKGPHNSVIQHCELNTTTISNNHDCFLKIANFDSQLHKNINYKNDVLFKKLVSFNLLPLIKVKRL